MEYVPISLYPYSPISLYPSIPISLHPHIPISLSLHPYIPISLYPYIPISLYPYILISLYPYIPISLYPHIPISFYPYIPTSFFAHREYERVVQIRLQLTFRAQGSEFAGVLNRTGLSENHNVKCAASAKGSPREKGSRRPEKPKPRNSSEKKRSCLFWQCQSKQGLREKILSR